MGLLKIVLNRSIQVLGSTEPFHYPLLSDIKEKQKQKNKQIEMANTGKVIFLGNFITVEGKSHWIC